MARRVAAKQGSGHVLDALPRVRGPVRQTWTARHVDAGVFSATIPVCAVLAVFGDEREQELVVNPNMLRNRVVLDETLRARPRGVAYPLFADADCVRVGR